jgi:hypothetical protein
VVGRESPWGWMVVGVLLGVLGAFVIGVASTTAVVTAGIAVAAIGGTVVFVSGVAAGVANGMARHEYLRSKR